MKHETMIIINPSTYEIIKEVQASTSQEIDASIATARKNFEFWSNLTVTQRVEALQKLYNVFSSSRNEIAQSVALEMGMPISVAILVDIEIGLSYMQSYLDQAPAWLQSEILYKDSQAMHQMFFEPYGVVGVSIPWNYPFCNFIWAVVQNLVVGNTVVVKHSENCVLTTKLIEEMFHAASFPAGVCNFVYGKGFDVGNYLIHSDIDMIWFTGSVQTGSVVYQAAAQKSIPIILELGGSAPGIVFPDADLDAALNFIYMYRFINSGQTCDALKRLIVHESIFDEVVGRLKRIVEQKRVGPALELTTEIGPLVSKKQVEILQAQVDDAVGKGAKIVTGGKTPENLTGAYFQPTILTHISKDMDVWTQEVFGPVLAVVPFQTDQQAIELANDTQFGLGAYLYTRDQQRIEKVCKALKTGNISVNAANYLTAWVPFGGYKHSGIGRIHGKLGMQSLCRIKTVSQPTL